MFYQVGLEEQKIRKDPVARTSEILKKVFRIEIDSFKFIESHGYLFVFKEKV